MGNKYLERKCDNNVHRMYFMSQMMMKMIRYSCQIFYFHLFVLL